MRTSTKSAAILTVNLTLASLACSSKDNSYDQGTAYPTGGNVMPADGAPPAAVAGAMVAPAEPLPPLTPEEIGATINYTVKGGDSLWLIAKNHKISISRLKRVNMLETDNIQAGQNLKIPDQAGATPPVATPQATVPKAAPPAAGGFRRPPTTATPPAQAAPKDNAGSGLKIQD